MKLIITQDGQGANEPGFAQLSTSAVRGVDEQGGAYGHDNAEQQFSDDRKDFQSIVLSSYL